MTEHFKFITFMKHETGKINNFPVQNRVVGCDDVVFGRKKMPS